MKTYVRRQKRDITQIHPSIPLNSHHQKESDTINGVCPTLTKSSPAENKDNVEAIIDLPLAHWVPSRKWKKTRSLASVAAWAQRAPDVVWAQRAPEIWWPAEVMIREFLLAPNSETEIAGQGQVYIRYYGGEECALVDPARDLSPFDHCFKRRSANPSDDFQEALKQAMQAIKKKETKQGTDSS